MIKVELVAVHHLFAAVLARAPSSLFAVDVRAPPVLLHDHLHCLAVQADGRAFLDLARERLHASVRRPPYVVAAVMRLLSNIHIPCGHHAPILLTALGAGLPGFPRLPRVPARLDAPVLDGDARLTSGLPRRTLAVAAQSRLPMILVHQLPAPALVSQTYGAPRAVRGARTRALAADALLPGDAPSGALLRAADAAGFVPITRSTASAAHLQGSPMPYFHPL